VSGPASRLSDPAAMAAVAVDVRATARQVSTRLGAPEPSSRQREARGTA
jgi:DNA-binding IclR family transcriptional regulator